MKKQKVDQTKKKIANLKVKPIKQSQGITLIALVVTIVVLLILAGVSILVLFGDNGIIKQAENVTDKFSVEVEREKIENVRVNWWMKKRQEKSLTVEDFFKMLEPDIIEKREDDVIGPDDKNTYILEANAGYTAEIIIDENGNIQIGKIEKGSLEPKIRDIKIKTTENSITAKAIVARAEGKTITYEYKLEAEPDSNYNLMTPVTDGTYIASGLITNERYIIRVSIKPTDPQIADTRIAIARDCRVTGITLNKTEENVEEGKEITLEASVTPEYAEDKSITWKSSDESIATVDNNGKVKGIKTGTATITAIANGGENKKATCTVTVLEIESNWALIGRIAKHIATRTDITIDSDTKNVRGKTENNEEYNITVGDTFKVRYNGEDYPGLRTVRVLGFKHDDLADETVYGGSHEKAGITFEFVDFLTDTKRKVMNASSQNTNGWAATEMREYLNGYNSKTTDSSKIGVLGGEATKLSNGIQIKKVKKEYMASNGVLVETLPKTEDYLWMLSCGEIFNNSGLARQKEGFQYAYYKEDTTNKELIKRARSNDTKYDWWLRSLYSNWMDEICLISVSGEATHGRAATSYGVAPGFSI